jgi:hypothetical protein
MSAAYLTTAELVERWGKQYSTSTLRSWRKRKVGPAWSQPGGPRGKVLYSLSAIEAYERKHGMAPKEEA